MIIIDRVEYDLHLIVPFDNGSIYVVMGDMASDSEVVPASIIDVYEPERMITPELLEDAYKAAGYSWCTMHRVRYKNDPDNPVTWYLAFSDDIRVDCIPTLVNQLVESVMDRPPAWW